MQKYAIPIIKGARDLMACAQTGKNERCTHDLVSNESNTSRDRVIILLAMPVLSLIIIIIIIIIIITTHTPPN